jgi:RNA polymerase sigma-70 factor (ECF subfamily)
MYPGDPDILKGLKADDQAALRHLFDLYFSDLVLLSARMVVNAGVAEEIVEDVFIQVWHNRYKLELTGTFKGYLYSSVKNRSVNYLKSKYGRMRFEDLDGIADSSTEPAPDIEMQVKELEASIQQAIEKLPPRCRTIFVLSRNAGFTTEEISRDLGISRKTVQAQIAIAMDKIHKHLHTF